MIEDHSGVMEVTEEPHVVVSPLLTGATGSDTVTVRVSGVLPSNLSILIRPVLFNNGACFGDVEHFLFILVCFAGTPSCLQMFCIHNA